MIDRYVSPTELRRLLSALLVVTGFISIAALFGFLIVPGLLRANQPAAEIAINAPQGETGWLDTTDYPPARREVIPPIDPKTVLSPTPELNARGKVLYDQTCATCHGATGRGDGPGAGQQNPRPRNFTAKDGWKNGSRIEEIFKTLDEGIKGSSMVSYNYLNKKDRMALVHVVQALGGFDHGSSDPKARAALEKLFASAGETIPNRVPVKVAEGLLLREFQPAPALAAGTPLLRQALTDPARAAQTLAALPGWKDSDQALARGVVAGLPFNGFAPAVATFGPERWKELRAALVTR